MEAQISPAEQGDAKARHLRALYRRLNPPLREPAPGKVVVDQLLQAEQWHAVQAEYRRLYPGDRDKFELAQLLTCVWKEERELAGERYDYGRQAWIGSDGRPLI